MYPNPTYFPMPPCLPLPLQRPPSKTKTKPTKHCSFFPPILSHIHLLQWHRELQCVTQYHFIQKGLLANVLAVNYWPCSSTLSIPHSNSSQISCYHGDPVAMVPEDQSLHVLQQAIHGIDVGVGQLKTLDVGLGVAELVNGPLLGLPPAKVRGGTSSPVITSLLPHRPVLTRPVRSRAGYLASLCSF